MATGAKRVLYMEYPREFIIFDPESDHFKKYKHGNIQEVFL